MPGMYPSFASSRKQMRQRLKSRRYPRRRPQRKHLRTTRERYLGGRCAFAMSAFFAIGACNNKAAERLEQSYASSPEPESQSVSRSLSALKRYADVPEEGQRLVPGARRGDDRHRETEDVPLLFVSCL